MKMFKSLLLVATIVLFASCSDDDETVVLEVESATATNIQATQTSDYTTTPPTIIGEYAKFSFETGTTVTGDDWDIAFRGTSIIVNGGEATTEDEPARTAAAAAYVTTGTLAAISEVDVTAFVQDNATTGLAIPTGSGNGWYSYDYTTHLITPIAGKVIVVKTHDNHYAKFEITSYYLDGDTTSEGQYYTFNYVYNPNEGALSF